MQLGPGKHENDFGTELFQLGDTFPDPANKVVLRCRGQPTVARPLAHHYYEVRSFFADHLIDKVILLKSPLTEARVILIAIGREYRVCFRAACTDRQDRVMPERVTFN